MIGKNLDRKMAKLYKIKKQSEKQRITYNKISKNYKWVQNKTFIGKLKSHNYRQVQKKLIKGSLLDIGTGNGDFFKIKEITNRPIKAFDVSDKMIEMAKKNIKKKVHFFCADLETIRLKEKFDNIISINVLHRSEEKKFIKLIKNCSNKKTKIIIVTMNFYSPQFLFIRFIQKLLGIFGYNFGDQVAKKGYTDNNIIKNFKDFKVIKIENHGYFHNFLRLECGFFLDKFFSFLDEHLSKIPIINLFGVSKLIILKKN